MTEVSRGDLQSSGLTCYSWNGMRRPELPVVLNGLRPVANREAFFKTAGDFESDRDRVGSFLLVPRVYEGLDPCISFRVELNPLFLEVVFVFVFFGFVGGLLREIGDWTRSCNGIDWCGGIFFPAGDKGGGFRRCLRAL